MHYDPIHVGAVIRALNLSGSLGLQDWVSGFHGITTRVWRWLFRLAV
jgi:hypothetical protein